MRAKEYLELNKDTIKYYDDIKRIIRDLLPLRRNKIATFGQKLSMSRH